MIIIIIIITITIIIIIIITVFTIFVVVVVVVVVMTKAAYSVFLHDELSEIALVCQSIPRALQYICYTIDTLFLDGLNDADDDALSYFSDPSMQVSAAPTPPKLVGVYAYIYIYIYIFIMKYLI